MALSTSTPRRAQSRGAATARAAVLFALGPGEVVSAYRDWRSGMRTLSQTSLTFSGQTLDCCEAHGVDATLVSSAPGERRTLTEGRFRLVNLPKPALLGDRGPGYYLNDSLYAMQLLRLARKCGVRTAIVDSGTTRWSNLWPWRAAGIEIIPNFHNPVRVTQTPAGTVSTERSKSLSSRLRETLQRADFHFLRHGTRVALGCSPQVARDYLAIASPGARCIQYYAQFDASDFAAVAPPTDGPFTVLFVGRATRAKGLFDLLDIAQWLIQRGAPAFVFQVCGDGDDLASFRGAVGARGMADRFILRGQLERPALLKAYRDCHAVVVPSRSDFGEGMPMVCAEAVLCHRPVVTSRVANALELMGDAALEARVDDPSSYAARLLTLMTDATAYAHAVAACEAAGNLFVDRARHGLGAAIAQALGLSGSPLTAAAR
jgi:glycosyltransferase involved in cell wall biosynthesis